MPPRNYRLSVNAANDIAEIFDFGMDRFGFNQSFAYQGKLENCFRNLAENPLLGRRAYGLDVGVRRLECQSHVIFYELDNADNVFVLRVLHASADPYRVFEDRWRRQIH